MTIIKQLTVLLSNHIEGSLAVKMYHWNVEGIHFSEYHSFFAEVYAEYDDQIDKLAEFIRIVSGTKTYVEMLSQDVHNNMTISPDHTTGSDVVNMTTQVEMINSTLITEFKQLNDAAETEGHVGLANYCADRLESLTKLDWKLKAMTK